MAPAEMLRRVIEASGMSARGFARDVLLRDERTVRRWLAGDSPIPEPVVAKLDEWLLMGRTAPADPTARPSRCSDGPPEQ